MSPRLPRLAFVVVVIATLIAALLPNRAAPDLGGGDKLNHIAAFVVLSLVAAWAWPRAALWRIALWLSVFGGLIEVLQALPAIARDADAADWGFDTLAVALTLAIVAALRRPPARV